ncbi:Palmitoleoyl-protein carboxylesterase notum1 [Oopsacas minuta]|uniref:Palmitoleoyl-protein carboxylesterase notum1 n=1 Tax=Oopsacas minuta TaxID=111878 RepID=A0AAV7K0X5_9METZ|nr:Palmitoleoyl-protein carboxylesterase notum1 [Oopsacas minuta]
MDLINFSYEYAKRSNALCLDGSPSGFYFKSGSNSSHWVIFLGGDVHCATKTDCKRILSTSSGSSYYWAPWLSKTFILSSSQYTNPDFYSWMKVYIPSCSADFFSGQHTEPNEWGMYFSGHNILTAVINMLLENYQLSRAEYVLFSGVSTGGVGVIEHSDYISDWLSFAKVKVSPVGGWFYPQLLLNFTEWTKQSPSNQPSSFLNTLYDSYVHKMCAENNYLQPWVCGPSNVGYLYQYIRTPLFVAENMFDSDQLFRYLGCPENSDLSEEYMNYYGQLMIFSMQQVARSSKFDGIFLPACLNHTIDLLEFTSSPRIRGYSYANALGDWFYNRNGYSQLIDDCSTPNCNDDCILSSG